jgi:hypothetical protein
MKYSIMKKLTILSLVILSFLLPFLPACQSGSQVTTLLTSPPTTSATPSSPSTPIPSGTLPPTSTVQSPDDIVFTPGGVAYRANVHQEGVPDKWPSIPLQSNTLGSGSDNLTVTYRPPITTKAGTTRNDIIDVYKTGTFLINNVLELYSVGVQDGIKLYIGSGGGLMGELRVVVVIDVGSGVATGQYTFQIGVILDGKDYGTVPCKVTVTS